MHPSDVILYLGMFLYLTACIAGVVAVCSRTRQTILKTAYAAIGLSTVFILFILGHVANLGSWTIGAIWAILFSGIPFAFGLLAIYFLRQKERSRKDTPPPRGPDE